VTGVPASPPEAGGGVGSFGSSATA
jgi:hypothetical protein